MGKVVEDDRLLILRGVGEFQEREEILDHSIYGLTTSTQKTIVLKDSLKNQVQQFTQKIKELLSKRCNFTEACNHIKKRLKQQ